MAINMVTVSINGVKQVVEENGRILDYLDAQGIEHPHICYSEITGPIQTCDTCMCEIDGTLKRACSTTFTNGMEIKTNSELAKSTQTEAMDRILENHMLYCTVCDNNNGKCRVHEGS
jgi:formate dehydrogenase major subunit